MKRRRRVCRRCISFRCRDPVVVPFLSSVVAHLYLRSNHGRTKLLNKSNLTIIVAGRSHFYNDSMGSLSNKNQMLELQSQLTPKGSQSLSGDEIC
ncbi:NBS-LRR type resistance protein [Cucumis melo var. makuwa]|uniref:NBS-LRR type resistance protein n=1 Tax=Cucumis melo var. makuwa TaxID=1194695 RepID=A0A5A7UWT5_CUCMM|nr:NBS-LRR type resistance protein [Cucumis melo var. makuwa]TYK29970.1 NBS-LRR type resistance protein [Cucumis melo var. makuwa]